MTGIARFRIDSSSDCRSCTAPRAGRVAAFVADQALYPGDLLEFFNVRPTVISKPGAIAVPQPVRSGFEFRNVSFEYPGNPRRVPDNVSFSLRPSERVALVGENGEGKTTIVKLLTRLYDPTAGQILFDGVDPREYILRWDVWRRVTTLREFAQRRPIAGRNT